MLMKRKHQKEELSKKESNITKKKQNTANVLQVENITKLNFKVAQSNRFTFSHTQPFLAPLLNL